LVGRLDRPSSRWNSAGTADGLRRRPVFVGSSNDEPICPLDLGPPRLRLDLDLERHGTRCSRATHAINMGNGDISECDWQTRLRSAGSEQRRRSLLDRIALHRSPPPDCARMPVLLCRGPPAGTPAGVFAGYSLPAPYGNRFSQEVRCHLLATSRQQDHPRSRPTPRRSPHRRRVPVFEARSQQWQRVLRIDRAAARRSRRASRR
jgi:hypothetical protein